jgi:hypothetical protein
MKIYKTDYTLFQIRDFLESSIRPFLEKIETNNKRNGKKIIEVCQIGKFLMLYNNGININRLYEQPDFILNNNGLNIGLEHQMIVDPGLKEKEGFIENIFSHAETAIRQDERMPNFLANCYIKPNLEYKLNQKKELISNVTEVVTTKILNNTFIDNRLIESISIMRHSKIRISPNFGGWMQKTINWDLILDAIKNKESKVALYQENSVPIQWLLLVISGIGASSYEVEQLEDLNIVSNFEKIFLLEDFKNIMYELK